MPRPAPIPAFAPVASPESDAGGSTVEAAVVVAAFVFVLVTVVEMDAEVEDMKSVDCQRIETP